MARRPAYVFNGSTWDEIGDPSKVAKTGDTITGPTVVDVNSSSTALEVRQTGSGNALVVEDSANPDSTPFVVDASGNVGIGTSSPSSELHVRSSGTDEVAVFLEGRTADSDGASAAAVVLTNPSTVSGASGQLAIMRGLASGSTAGNRGGAITFSTKNNNGSSVPERMRIDSAGNVGIGTTSPANILHISSTNSVQQFDNFGTGTSRIVARGARGTASAPTASQADDTLLNVDARGYGATGFNSGARVQIAMKASENYTDSANGTYMEFLTTPTGSTTLTSRMRIAGDGLITGTGTSLGAWTAYTPTLGGTGWAIGNGTATGAYCQIGKVVHWRVKITFGSTSTFAAAVPTVTVPVSANANNEAFVAQGWARDVSLGDNRPLFLVMGASAAEIRYLFQPAASLGNVSDTAPFTWANGDIIRISGTYEAA